MKWDKDKSVLLSQGCIVFFALCLLALDIGAWWLAKYMYGEMRETVCLTCAVYAGSVFGWICLWQLWKLLGLIRRGEVFVSVNVQSLRTISWCCFGAAAILLVCSFLLLPLIPFGFAAFAAGFVGLIARVLKNAFEQAVAMKNELDLTV